MHSLQNPTIICLRNLFDCISNAFFSEFNDFLFKKPIGLLIECFLVRIQRLFARL